MQMSDLLVWASTIPHEATLYLTTTALEANAATNCRWWPENGLLEGIRFCDMRAHFWTRLQRKNNYAGAQKWASKNPKIGTSGKTIFGHAHTNACPPFFATELPLQLHSNSSPNLLPIICFFNQQGTLNYGGHFIEASIGVVFQVRFWERGKVAMGSCSLLPSQLWWDNVRCSQNRLRKHKRPNTTPLGVKSLKW